VAETTRRRINLDGDRNRQSNTRSRLRYCYLSFAVVDNYAIREICIRRSFAKHDTSCDVKAKVQVGIERIELPKSFADYHQD